MDAMAVFKGVLVLLVVTFLVFGMDVRRKPGTGYFVAPVWQRLMRICAFTLLAGFVWMAFSLRYPAAIDWLALVVLVIGTAFIAAAKRALGAAHTFTGQFLQTPGLVTHGVYAVSRNPLYLGVFLCEAGAALLVVHQAPLLLPQHNLWFLGGLALLLGYAMAFNGVMAHNEARYLQDRFGDAYRDYQDRVPFLIPRFPSIFAPGVTRQRHSIGEAK